VNRWPRAVEVAIEGAVSERTTSINSSCYDY
jgi:hypothetical protein